MGILGLVFTKNRLSLASLTKQHGILSIVLGVNNKLSEQEMALKISNLGLTEKNTWATIKAVAADTLHITGIKTKIKALFSEVAATWASIDAKEINTVSTVKNTLVQQISNEAILKGTKIHALASIAWTKLTGSIKTATTANKAFLVTATRFATALTAVLGIVAAMAGLAALIYTVVTAQKRHNEQLKETINLSKEVAENAANENASLRSLKKTYDELNEKVSLNAEEKEILLETEADLLEVFPELIRGYDAEGNAIYDNTQLMDAYTEKNKRKYRSSCRSTRNWFSK